MPYRGYETVLNKSCLTLSKNCCCKDAHIILLVFKLLCWDSPASRLCRATPISTRLQGLETRCSSTYIFGHGLIKPYKCTIYAIVLINKIILLRCRVKTDQSMSLHLANTLSFKTIENSISKSLFLTKNTGNLFEISSVGQESKPA